MKKDKIYGNSVHSPCKDCPDRHIGCHSECDKYKEFEKALFEEKSIRYKANNAEKRATNHEIRSKLRTIKRQGKK